VGTYDGEDSGCEIAAWQHPHVKTTIGTRAVHRETHLCRIMHFTAGVVDSDAKRIEVII
jgi:hypothetical protein